MALRLADGAPSLLIRRVSYERVGLERASIDARLGLTADEFRVEGDLVAIGPIYDDVALGDMIGELEALGLEYYEDFFDLSGNWPAWLALHVTA